MLFYECTYLSKIKGFCKHSVMMLKFQPSPLRETCLLALHLPLASLRFSQAGCLLHCQSISTGKVETCFIFHSSEVLTCGGGKRLEEGRGFFGLAFVGFAGFWFLFNV